MRWGELGVLASARAPWIPQNTMADAAEEPTKDDKGRPFITRATLAQHGTREDCWMSISGKVYDVTKYLEDHPGGEEVLIDRAGKDATEDFEDVGHSNEARKQLKAFEKGELPPSERAAAAKSSEGGGGGMGLLLVPVLAIVAGVGYYFYSEMM